MYKNHRVSESLANSKFIMLIVQALHPYQSELANRNGGKIND